VTVTSPFARIVQPKVIGLDNVPTRGALLIGNHTLYGFLDLPFMMGELWTRRRIAVRGLGDHAHYAVPVWRDLLEMCGMVRGTRENVRELMHEGQHILVFPGGADEVFKPRRHKYELMWKERLGFARLAIEQAYPIVPFAAVGAEEMLDILADRDTAVLHPVAALTKRLVGLPLPPLARGIGPTMVPRPERLYFWFGQPIDTARLEGRGADDDAARRLRDEVKAAVEGGIATLQAERERDPQRGLARRLMHRPKSELPELAVSDPPAWFVTKAFEAWNTSGPEGAAAWLSRWVQLTDPPRWPGSGTWRGREAAVARLAEVSRELGAEWAEVDRAESVGNDEVLVSFHLRRAHPSPADPELEFHARVETDSDQITSIRIFVESEDLQSAAGRLPSTTAQSPTSR
jgi:1-acyl-sn-glycerol-3-phosphate acyltransferase